MVFSKLRMSYTRTYLFKQKSTNSELQLQERLNEHIDERRAKGMLALLVNTILHD
jgi:hypothetical protein